MALRNILFDLDGTLTDASAGIVRSVQHALGELGHDVPTVEELTWCVGPDIRTSFARLLESEDRTYVERALGIYRARYVELGIYENELYPDVPAVLEQLHAAGKHLFVATSKPEPFASRLLAHFALDRFFEGVHAPDLDGRFAAKSKLLARLLADRTLSRRETVFVGDREHDVAAARLVGIRSLAVTYGYGTREELERARPDNLCTSPSEIPSALGFFD